MVERVSVSQRRVARKGCAYYRKKEKKEKKEKSKTTIKRITLNGSEETNGVGILREHTNIIFSYMEPTLFYSEARS